MEICPWSPSSENTLGIKTQDMTGTDSSLSPTPYRDFGSWIRRQFPFRVQKLSVDAGFSCPNRDGRVSTGGCTFCDNRTFNPSYCRPEKSIRQQIEDGKEFFRHKYPDMRYLAYFQAFSNTYAPLDVLKRRYEEALSADGVVGLVIGTRPDCVPDETLDYLEQLSRQTFLIVEYGIESTCEETLLRINRGHTFAQARAVIDATAERGITTSGHVIIGLPGESPADIIRQAAHISATRLHILKCHQLQVIRGTRLAEEYRQQPFHVFTPDEYIETIGEYLRHLRPDIIVERFVSQSPAGMVLAPHWGLKNHEFANRLMQHLRARGIHQGELFE